jgi:hypothetical protein
LKFQSNVTTADYDDVLWRSQTSPELGTTGPAFIRRTPEAASVYTDITGEGVIIDLHYHTSGWLKVSAGEAPQFEEDPDRRTRGPQPSFNHKRCFSVAVATLDGEVSTWRQNTAGALKGFAGLIGLANAAPPAPDDDHVPVFRCTGHTTTPGKMGAVVAPSFAFVRWLPRPDFLPAPIVAPAPRALGSVPPPPKPRPPGKVRILGDEIPFRG